jgi:hypothetical protein
MRAAKDSATAPLLFATFLMATFINHYISEGCVCNTGFDAVLQSATTGRGAGKQHRRVRFAHQEIYRHEPDFSPATIQLLYKTSWSPNTFYGMFLH